MTEYVDKIKNNIFPHETDKKVPSITDAAIGHITIFERDREISTTYGVDINMNLIFLAMWNTKDGDIYIKNEIKYSILCM